MINDIALISQSFKQRILVQFEEFYIFIKSTACHCYVNDMMKLHCFHTVLDKELFICCSKSFRVSICHGLSCAARIRVIVAHAQILLLARLLSSEHKSFNKLTFEGYLGTSSGTLSNSLIHALPLFLWVISLAASRGAPKPRK